MARVRLSAGRSRPASSSARASYVGGRSAALSAALTAAGAPLLPTYDMTRGSHARRVFDDAVMRASFATLDGGLWPSEAVEFVGGVRDEVFREGHGAVYRLPDGTLAHLELGHGWARLDVAGGSEREVADAASMFRALYPPTYLDATDDRVPVTFWSLGPFGPVQRLRMIDASPWETIQRNYSSGVRAELDGLMTSFEPGAGGLLLLWQGPPGTGKTWALRALVSEWLPWAEFHYITDPDAFFVENAAYMIDVLLADSYGAIDEPSGEVFEEADPLGKWRVLILEDTGELLSANAKEKYGQGLSRLLNVVDGLIGQGLRVLVLVTTNDELGELNPAVRRPGRCASQIEFVPMSPEEAAEWLGAQEAEAGTTLAELYARAGAEPTEPLDAIPPDVPDLVASSAVNPLRRFATGGVVPATGDVAPALLPRSGFALNVRQQAILAAAASERVVSAIRAVAEEHAPEGGYGETAYHAGDRAVFWVCADWTSNEEHDAAEQAFLAIDGVDQLDHDAECALPDGEGWEQVWPAPDSETALERAVALARRPLDV